MTKFVELLGKGGPAAIVVVISIITVLGGIIYWRMRHKKVKSEQQPKIADVSGMEEEAEQKEQKQIKRGTGIYNAIVICKDIIDFTTIPEPIGELYQFDTSCPISGSGYIVKELPDGTLADYDPRELSVVVEETPEYAWFATHWSIVKEVFSVPVQWWKSMSTWYAVGLMLIVFISALVVLGGD